MIKFIFLFVISLSTNAALFDSLIKALPDCKPAESSTTNNPLMIQPKLTTRIVGIEKGKCKLIKMMKEKLMETCYLSSKEQNNIKNSKSLAKAFAKPGVCTKTQLSL